MDRRGFLKSATVTAVVGGAGAQETGKAKTRKVGGSFARQPVVTGKCVAFTRDGRRLEIRQTSGEKTGPRRWEMRFDLPPSTVVIERMEMYLLFAQEWFLITECHKTRNLDGCSLTVHWPLEMHY